MILFMLKEKALMRWAGTLLAVRVSSIYRISRKIRARTKVRWQRTPRRGAQHLFQASVMAAVAVNLVFSCPRKEVLEKAHHSPKEPLFGLVAVILRTLSWTKRAWLSRASTSISASLYFFTTIHLTLAKDTKLMGELVHMILLGLAVALLIFHTVTCYPLLTPFLNLVIQVSSIWRLHHPIGHKDLKS